MKKKLTSRDFVMITLLVVLLIGVCYYLFFLTPLKNEMAQVNNQISEANSELEVAAAKVASMNQMQAELDEILARPADEITEIAPYNNAKALMNELNGILAQGTEYSISFSDPDISEDGIVRRSVQLSFTASSYANAKTIVEQLANNRWRCLITDVSTSSEDNIANGSVSVEAIMIFFESTNLS